MDSTRGHIIGYKIPALEYVRVGPGFSCPPHLEMGSSLSIRPSFVFELDQGTDFRPFNRVEWIEIRHKDGQQPKYFDYVRESRPDGRGQCPVSLGRYRLDLAGEEVQISRNLLSFDAENGASSQMTSTMWDNSPEALYSEHSPVATQTVLRRYPKLVYSTVDTTGGRVEWITVAISGLRIPERRWSPLEFSTSGSRVVGFVVDNEARPPPSDHQERIVILDY